MKKVFLLFMSVATLMSCSDDGIEPKKSENDECKITKIEENENGGQMNFSFDQQGNVTKIVDNMNTDYVTDNIQADLAYSKDKITVTEVYNGKETWKNEYFLENNKVIYSLYYNENSQTSRTNYQYNAEGYLTKIISGIPREQPVNTVITYIDGNISNVKVSSESGNSWENTEYSATYNNQPRLAYTEYLVAPFGEWFLIESGEAVLYEKGFFGKKVKNQLVSVKNNLESEVFSYGSDSNGKTNSITYDTPLQKRTYTLTFDCK